MKKQQLKVGIITFILYIALSALSVGLLKYCDNVTLAFSVYYILQAAFVFLLSSFDSLWGFCAYSFTALVMNFILPFPSYSLFILSALATISSIAVLRIFLGKLHAGSLLSFALAALLRYVIEHYAIGLLSKSIAPSQFETVKGLLGIPGLICTLVLIALTVLLYPAVKLAVGNTEPAAKNDENDSETTKGHNDVGNISNE